MRAFGAASIDWLSNRIEVRLACLGVTGGVLCCLDPSLVGAALPQLMKQGLSDGEASCFVATFVGGLAFASLFARRILARCGFSGGLRLAAAMVIAGCTTVCLSGGNGLLLFGGRFVHGCGIGLLFVFLPLELSEQTRPDVRGRMMCLFQMAMTAGLFLGSFVGWISAVCLDGCAWMADYGFSVVPAVALLAQSRGADVGGWRVETPVCECADASFGSPEKACGIFRMVFAVAIPAFVQLTGVGIIVHYAVCLLTEAGLCGASANVADCMVKGLNALSTVVAFALIDRWGRRPLMLLGLGGVACSLFAAGWWDGRALAVCLGVYVISFAIGPGSCGWLLPPELLPERIRLRGMSVAAFGSHAASILVTATFLPLLSSLGRQRAFAVYGVLACLFLAVVSVALPETKARRLSRSTGTPAANGRRCA